MRTILFSTLIAIVGCATTTTGGEQADDTATGKADAASRPVGTYTNPAPHAGELASLTLAADHTFTRARLVECAQGVIDCAPIIEAGTYRFTRSSSEHFLRFYGDDGGALDRLQWDLADGNLELHGDGAEGWYELTAASAQKTCGGFFGAGCDDGAYCDYGASSCGAADRSGVCKPIPFACLALDMPVCGCNGVSYANPCEANKAGSSTLHDGTCTTN